MLEAIHMILFRGPLTSLCWGRFARANISKAINSQKQTQNLAVKNKTLWQWCVTARYRGPGMMAVQIKTYWQLMKGRKTTEEKEGKTEMGKMSGQSVIDVITFH